MAEQMAEETDVIVVGAGLSGLVAATEIADAGKRVIVVDQEGEQSLGGQAFWSFGGLFLVDSPEQRRLGIKDSFDLAMQDWLGTAGFDRDEDFWPRQWADAYVAFAAGEKRAWLRAMGHRIFPVVGWAERGGYDAMGHGNSVPRFHVTWGTGPGIVEPFERRAREAVRSGRLSFRFRHRVDALSITNGTVDGVGGAILAPDNVERGKSSSRNVVGEFALKAQAVIVASGGIGGNHELVRQNWPKRLGAPPKFMISGVPEHVDGRMIGITEKAGARLINRDRMWHYVEGIQNWSPIWPRHGIRILPGPSSMWFDATGTRLPAPLFPGSDTLGQLQYIMSTGYDYSWFILTQSIIKKEFALSGSEQNPDLTGKSWRMTIKRATQQGRAGAGGSVQKPWCRLHRARQDRGSRCGHEQAGRQRPPQARAHQDADRGARPRDRQPLRQGCAGDEHSQCAALYRRQTDPHRLPSPHPRSRARAADRGQAQHPHPQDARRFRDRPLFARVRRGGQRHPRPLCSRRSRRLRRRRRARLSFAGRHVPRRLPVLGPQCGPGRGEGRGLDDAAAAAHRGVCCGISRCLGCVRGYDRY
ncbi:putative oxidoreductase [Bradyrhizobium sp. GM22.5]